MSIFLIESGGETPSAFSSDLSKACIADARRHAAMEIASCRALGGTSRWWGGRCVPFDDIDFASRPHAADAVWPIDHADVRVWYDAAAKFFKCGPARFTSKAARWSDLDGVAFQDLERWAPRVNMGLEYRALLAQSEAITVLLGATVTGLGLADDGKAINRLTIADRHTSMEIAVSSCVLACGGLETTRLLLAAQRHRPGAFGGRDGALGRYYIGHISGKIADLVFENPADIAAHDFFLHDGAFARRRFTFPAKVQEAEELLNIAFWADNPPFHDPTHKSGVLSLIWLALAMPLIGKRLLSEGVRLSHLGQRPFRYLAHLKNVVGSPLNTLAVLGRIIKDRFLSSPRKPGFLVPNKGGRYALHYHAEQVPGPASRVCLGTGKDALGMPRLAIDLRYGDRDCRSVVRAHQLLDGALRASGLGRLEYRVAEEDRLASIMAQASDGFHQIGATRMGHSPSSSIVDRNCRVHGVDNLYIVSTGVFASGSQANPTFLAVALALRLANQIADKLAADMKMPAFTT